MRKSLVFCPTRRGCGINLICITRILELRIIILGCRTLYTLRRWLMQTTGLPRYQRVHCIAHALSECCTRSQSNFSAIHIRISCNLRSLFMRFPRDLRKNFSLPMQGPQSLLALSSPSARSTCAELKRGQRWTAWTAWTELISKRELECLGGKERQNKRKP